MYGSIRMIGQVLLGAELPIHGHIKVAYVICPIEAGNYTACRVLTMETCPQITAKHGRFLSYPRACLTTLNL